MYLNTSFKYRKNHRYFLKNYFIAQSQSISQQKSVDRLVFSSYKAKSIKSCEYNAIRRLLGRKTEKLFRFNICRKADIMVTAKPKEIRMGKGKGSFSHVELPVKVGLILFNIVWCHRLPTFKFLFAVRKCIKKSGLTIHY